MSKLGLDGRHRDKNGVISRSTAVYSSARCAGLTAKALEADLETAKLSKVFASAQCEVG
jgi:hypothetical protein